MKKRLLASLLSLIMLMGAVSPTAFAAGGVSRDGSADPAGHWFRSQLTDQGKAIYDAMQEMYTAGMMEDGASSYDLLGNGVVEEAAVIAYLKGNRTLFNDFAAAKDAFDLEHPEAWYVDSSDLSFLVTSGADGALHAYIGPGRTEDYYVGGVKKAGGTPEAAAAGVRSMSAELKDAVDRIAAGARRERSAAGMVRYAHDRITHSISYRHETDCSAENAGYIRTAYALVTHEGVCEGYARSFQYVMNELGIPCVLIHGVQTSGEPEAHMWCAVWLADAGAWYVVDPTWDDPVGLDADGRIKTTGINGEDGGETETYLLVGQDVVGAHWRPSGYVSTSATAFTYPDIALNSYGAGTLERNGLKVVSMDSSMEDTPSTVYHVSFNGDGLVQSAKKGYYFLVRMYDLNADGSVNAFDDWYYSAHGLHAMGRSEDDFDPDNDFQNISNPNLGDTDGYLIYNVSNCEYVEFAVTTKAPPPWKDAMDLVRLGGYYSGDGSDIVAESGLIYNENGDYEQSPHVKNASPMFNSSVDVGRTYTMHMEFTDPLYHPDQASIDNAVEGKVNDAGKAMEQAVALDYTGTTYSWGVNARQPHTFTEKPEPQNVRWVCEAHGEHSGTAGIGAECRLTALEYEFSASRWWADDSVQYEFYLTGLVGRKSNKFLTNWSYVFENPSAHCSYRCSQGIDWNLWGQPQLLDNPNDLNFDEMTVRGVDGKEESLSELRARMRLDDYDMNGRLVLVVENLDASRSSTEELANAMEDVPAGAVLGSSLYEIDFARICGKTIVSTGDSLRLQIGFPPGFDSSMAGVEFKVYHFTRGADGSINGVEEIPVTVTRYGLVIVVRSFSPFAVVAVKSNGTQAGRDRCVVLTSGGHGTVTGDAEEAGLPGMVRFAEGDEHTFTITPDEGYVLDAVSFDGGRAITVGSGNTFTLEYADVADGNAVLHATFVKESIRKAEEEAGITVLPPAVCRHETTTGVQYLAPTCTDKGHTAGTICSVCGQALTESVELAELGHVYNGKDQCERCYAVKVCTVTFHANGGKLAGSPTMATGADGTLPSLPGAPVREGYTFDAWYRYTSANDSEPVTINTKFTEDTTVYAHWTEDTGTDGPVGPAVARVYRITLNASPVQGGTVAGSGVYERRETVTVTAAPADGYRFDSWMEDSLVVSTDPEYVFTATGNRTLTAVFERTGDSSGSGGNPGSGRPSGSGNNTAAAVENSDGSVTTTVTDPVTGTVTETTSYPDGLVIVVETYSNGVQVTATHVPGAPVAFSVAFPAGMGTVTVVIAAAVTPGTVAVDTVTGRIIQHSIPTADGLRIKLDRPTHFVLEDRGKVFSDTEGHWARDSISFVTAHELFSGTGTSTFGPNLPMTRAMLMTVLARLDGAETEGGGTWYEKGMAWAVANGISDGSDPEGQVTREQLAAMLWRYAGEPAAGGDPASYSDAGDVHAPMPGLAGSPGSLAPYPDAGDVHSWAGSAMVWAVWNGIINGSSDGRLNPRDSALRSEVSAMLTRFCRNIEN